MDNFNKEDSRYPLKSIVEVAGVLLRCFGIYAIGSVVALLFTRFVLKTDFSDINSFLESNLSKDYKQSVLQLAQGSAQFIQLIILPFLYFFLYNRGLFKIFLVNTRKPVYFVMMGFFLFFTILPLIQFIGNWNQSVDLPPMFDGIEAKMKEMEEVGKKATMYMIDYTTRSEFLISLIVIAILPAIGEELFFRGLMQTEIHHATKNPHIAIWIGAFVFSFVHFQFFGFFPRLLLGVFFGYMYFWSGNILIPMLLHFTNNAMLLILMHRFGEQFEKMEKSNIENTSPVLLVFSLVITGVLVFYSHRLYIERIAEDES